MGYIENKKKNPAWGSIKGRSLMRVSCRRNVQKRIFMIISRIKLPKTL